MANLSPLPRWAETDANGVPLAGGKLYSYVPSTLTPKATKTDQSGTVDNLNPVILDASGKADVWLEGAYRLILTDAQDQQIYDRDQINVSEAPFAAIDTTLRTASAGAGIEEDLQDDAIPANLLSPVKVLEYEYIGTSGVPGVDINTGILRIDDTNIFTASLSAGTLPGLNTFRFTGKLFMRDNTLSILFSDQGLVTAQRVEIPSFDASAGFNLRFRVSRDNVGNVINLDGSTVTVIG